MNGKKSVASTWDSCGIGRDARSQVVDVEANCEMAPCILDIAGVCIGRAVDAILVTEGCLLMPLLTV